MPLLLAVALLTLTLQQQSVRAGESPLIEWSKDRRLTRADFKGEVPQKSGTAAQSFVAIKAAWSCDADRFEPDIRAVFDPSRSTWAAGTGSGFSASNA